MISDAELQHYAEKDRDVWPDSLLADMAQELLQRRQADRAIWENAPDWAEWFARDSDSIGFYYSEEPEQGTDYWIEGGRNCPMREWGWKSSKQERPK